MNIQIMAGCCMIGIAAAAMAQTRSLDRSIDSRVSPDGIHFRTNTTQTLGDTNEPFGSPRTGPGMTNDTRLRQNRIPSATERSLSPNRARSDISGSDVPRSTTEGGGGAVQDISGAGAPGTSGGNTSGGGTSTGGGASTGGGGTSGSDITGGGNTRSIND